MMPTASNAPFIIAAVQAAPVFFRATTVDKACDLIVDARRNDAHLVVFLEAFIPIYSGLSMGDPTG